MDSSKNEERDLQNKKKKAEEVLSGVFEKPVQKGTPPPGHASSSHALRLPHRSRAQHVLPDQVMPLLVLQDDRFELFATFINQDVDDARVGDRRSRLEEGGDVAPELRRGDHVLEAVVLDGPGDEAADLFE